MSLLLHFFGTVPYFFPTNIFSTTTVKEGQWLYFSIVLEQDNSIFKNASLLTNVLHPLYNCLIVFTCPAESNRCTFPPVLGLSFWAGI